VNNTAEIASVEMDVLPVMHAANGLISVEGANTLATVGEGSLRPGLHHAHGGDHASIRPTVDSPDISPWRGGLSPEVLSAVIFPPTAVAMAEPEDGKGVTRQLATSTEL
jgi:hypothetical protein